MNRTKSNGFNLTLSQSSMYISFHIFITILIIVIALVGNGSVIYIFCKRNLVNGSNTFIIAFAVIDILSATLITPQICFDFLVNHSGYKLFIRREIFAVILNMTILSNVGLLSAVAIDRAWAVFKPFTYSANKRRHIQTITIILAICAFQTTIHAFGKHSFPMLRFITPIQILIGMSIVFVTYPTIVYKLYKGTRKIAPQPVLNQRNKRRLSIPKPSLHVSYISENDIRMQRYDDCSETRISR